MREIFDFINASKVATLCCVEDGSPHCFNCFYAFMVEYSAIVFKTSGTSAHVKIMENHATIAGTIYTCSANSIDNVGVQFKGEMLSGKQVSTRAS